MKNILLSLSIVFVSFISFGQDIEKELERVSTVFNSYNCKVDNGQYCFEVVTE